MSLLPVCGVLGWAIVLLELLLLHPAVRAQGIDDRVRPWRSCALEHRDYDTLLQQYEQNDARMCRESQREELVKYEQCVAGILPGFQEAMEDCADQFRVTRPDGVETVNLGGDSYGFVAESTSIVVRPRRPTGRVHDVSKWADIFVCEPLNMEPCWQERTQSMGLVAPQRIDALIEEHCWNADRVLLHDEYKLDTCHAELAYGARGCSKTNDNRPCWIDADAPVFVFAYYPWLEDADVYGPAQVSRQGGGGLEVIGLKFDTGDPGPCQVCLARNKALAYSGTAPDADECPAEGQGTGLYMHAYEQAREHTLSVKAASRRAYFRIRDFYSELVNMIIDNRALSAADIEQAVLAATRDTVYNFWGLWQECPTMDEVRLKQAGEVFGIVLENLNFMDRVADLIETTAKGPEDSAFTRWLSRLQVSGDPCADVRYTGSVAKSYGDIETMTLSNGVAGRLASIDIRRASTHDLGYFLACQHKFTKGCLLWDNSISHHVCGEGILYDANGNARIHSKNEWLRSTRYGARPAGRRKVDGSPFADADVELLAVHVPSMRTEVGFYGSFRFGLAESDWEETLADTVRSEAWILHVPDDDRTVLVRKKYFKLVVLDASTSLGEWREVKLHCECPTIPLDGFAQAEVFGAVERQGRVPLLHECTQCAATQFRELSARSVLACTSAVYLCVECYTQTQNYHSLRGADGERCVSCPHAHVASQWLDVAGDDRPYQSRVEACQLHRGQPCRMSLYEQLQLASLLYGWASPETQSREDHVRALQRFSGYMLGTGAGSLRHIEGRFLQGGTWTCHLCPPGFVLQNNPTRRSCRPLGLVLVRWTGFVADQGWQASSTCQGDSGAGCDEITSDALRAFAREVRKGHYVHIDRELQEITERQCPSGEYRIASGGSPIAPELHSGTFRHLCGRFTPANGMLDSDAQVAGAQPVYLRVVEASCDSASADCTGWPKASDLLMFDTKNNHFMQIARGQGSDPPTVRVSQNQYVFELGQSMAVEVVRGGIDIACQVCGLGEYNSGCTSDSGGSFGSCNACKTTPSAGKYLQHVLPNGCYSWTSGFVDRDYTEHDCRHVVVKDGGYFLCAGFCGHPSGLNVPDFVWWAEPSADIEEIIQSRFCPYPGTNSEHCMHEGAVFGTASAYDECSAHVPYCPPGFRVSTEGACDNLRERAFDPACCTQCVTSCQPGEVRSAAWELCPGSTSEDTQARCSSGCDIGYYLDASDDAAQTCVKCTDCASGVNAV